MTERLISPQNVKAEMIVCQRHPKGYALPTTLQRLKVKCLQRISGALGLATDVPAAQTRKGDGSHTFGHPSHCARY